MRCVRQLVRPDKKKEKSRHYQLQLQAPINKPPATTPNPATRAPKIASLFKLVAPLVDPALVPEALDEATVAVLEALDNTLTLAGKLLKLSPAPLAVESELVPVAVRVSCPPETEPVPIVMGMFSTEPVSVMRAVDSGSMTASVQVTRSLDPMPHWTETEMVAPAVSRMAPSETIDGPWRRVTRNGEHLAWQRNGGRRKDSLVSEMLRESNAPVRRYVVP